MCHYYSTYKCHTFRYSLKVLKGVINKKKKRKAPVCTIREMHKKKKKISVTMKKKRKDSSKDLSPNFLL